MLMMLSKPRSVFPINCNKETRPPVEGRAELQLESGVTTTSLQPCNNEVRSTVKGSSNMENIPELLVVALDITFPFAHFSCTSASTKRTGKFYRRCD